MKTSENLHFPDVFWEYKSGTLIENGLIVMQCRENGSNTLEQSNREYDENSWTFLCFYLQWIEIFQIRGLSIAHTAGATGHIFFHMIKWFEVFWSFLSALIQIFCHFIGRYSQIITNRRLCLKYYLCWILTKHPILVRQDNFAYKLRLLEMLKNAMAFSSWEPKPFLTSSTK